MSEPYEKRPFDLMDTENYIVKMQVTRAYDELDRLGAQQFELISKLKQQRDELSPRMQRMALRTLEDLMARQLDAAECLLHGPVGPAQMRRLRRRKESLTKIATKILQEAGHPMHVKELVEQLRIWHGAESTTESLASALLKRIRLGDPIERSAPNTFEFIHDGAPCGALSDSNHNKK